MSRSSCSLHRHRGGQHGASGGAAARTPPWRLRRLTVLLAVLALAWPSTNSLARALCSGGVEGIQSSNVCCLEACGVCGGDGCADIAGTEDTDCCVNDITNADVSCADNGGVAPCIVVQTPSPVAGAPAPLTSTTSPLTPSPTPSAPTAVPVAGPTGAPAAIPTAAPAAKPTAAPAAKTTAAPAAKPTAAPAASPTAAPAASLTAAPAASPTAAPAAVVMAEPSAAPAEPSATFPPYSPSFCSNGISGVQQGTVCCLAACGVCGGDGCSAVSAADCCYNDILNSTRICGVDGAVAPCVITPTPVVTPAPLAMGETRFPTPAPMPTLKPVPATPAPSSGSREGATEGPAAAGETAAPGAGTPAPMVDEGDESEEEQLCSNDLPGYQHGVVCCPLACGQCGGSGCDNISGTGGEDDCCSDRVLVAGLMCNATVSAPCIIGTVEDVENQMGVTVEASGARGVGSGGGGVAGVIASAGAAGAVAAAAAAWFSP